MRVDCARRFEEPNKDDLSRQADTAGIMSEPPLIDIRNATIWRGRTRVFDKLTLTIDRHERVAILGPNGSGKTTLLKIINRELYPVDRGDSWVRILGRERWNVWELRRHIGIVSQDLQQRYRPVTTALEVVLSGFLSSIGIHGNLGDRIDAQQVAAAHDILEQLGIAELAATPLRSMSTGQQRRCLLGRALVHHPDTLILDEPTSGLDFAASFDYLARIRALAREGCNIIIVTHHLNEIPPEVGRVVVLDQGRIAADGPKASVLTPELLSRVYGARISVAEIDGYFLAYPGTDNSSKT
ncbi:MAG: ATP-binding cassette domain-containing protein [Gammaproteobacteria bacterium]|jgi:iron complex transport system ATP-binding protein|nr:ATP-binding cassette domain-containing protein [Gammaproteobacteria bacterium]MDH3848182.1 ATP-binding cassette domain-containing protein [Gammaproteobacteria bacterium]MDH3862716.1 ATP-binding cassette domain-containing protein [Gammaproteobacteria bacterium]MDH3905891.1 ATP-binding cassette domain-containing protein [Gammaproteobacteria bacterium]MDH3953557.1 ATP-binding cassette domain-containing protein [Gammaproteobacteria bacterium]